VPDKPIAQALGVQLEVDSESLGNAQPDVIW
jgi:hypothetical protein